MSRRLSSPQHPIEKRQLLGNAIWRMDWSHRQLLIYEDDILYIMPIRQMVGIKIDFRGVPSNVKKFIILNIVMDNKMESVNKTYKSSVPDITIDKYPILHNILMLTLKLVKNPFDLNDKITTFRYGNEDTINVKLRHKINYLMQNYK